MTYAIIQIGGKQYRVSEGDEVVVDQIAAEQIKDGKLVVEDVLLVRNEKGIEVGAPVVSGAKVTLEHVENQKGDKIRVFKYKAKARSRKTHGHRQHQSVLRVNKIAA